MVCAGLTPPKGECEIKTRPHWGVGRWFPRSGRSRRPMIRHAVSPRASLVGGLACYDLNEQRLNLLPESNRSGWISTGNILESVCGSGFNWPAARRFAKLSPLFRIELPATTSAMNDSPVQAARCLLWLRIAPWSAVWRVTIWRNSVMEFRQTKNPTSSGRSQFINICEDESPTNGNATN